MQRTDNVQINSKVYWDYVYTTPAKQKEYWSNTARFPEALTHIKDRDKVMDLGCGVGVLHHLILKDRKECELWGVDISEEAVKINKEYNPQGYYQQGYIGSLTGIPQDYFDVVFSGETIEHLDDPNVLFDDAYRMLKKGGKLIITTPQEKHIESPEHLWYFTKDDIITLFTKAGFSEPTFTNLSDMEHIVVFFAVGIK